MIEARNYDDTKRVTFVQEYEERFERPYGFWRPYLKEVITRMFCGTLVKTIKYFSPLFLQNTRRNGRCPHPPIPEPASIKSRFLI
jgi:hypothetical protein